MKMLCFLCGKKIGLMRSLVDQQYCSAEHRKEARLASSQALREEEDVELWTVARSKDKAKVAGRGAPSAGQTASVFAFLTVAGLLVAALLLPGPGAAGGNAFPSVSLDPGVKPGFMSQTFDHIAEIVRQRAPVTLHADFHSDLSDWSATALRGTTKIDDPRDWISANRPELVLPGSLRIWKRSESLSNYQMEFQGEVEKKSLSWAFRASDADNYYASKVVITKPGPLPNASLIRYAVLNGREWDRVQLPLPVTLERGVDYRVRMSVQDDHFIAYLNGRVISSWTDQRLSRGGVGFFADEDDGQQVSWVSISERDSFMGRMLAHFSLLVWPGEGR
jgi:hypothetical protein